MEEEGKGCAWWVRKFSTSHLLSIYYVPSTVVSALDELTHLILKMTPFIPPCPPLAESKSEVQTGLSYLSKQNKQLVSARGSVAPKTPRAAVVGEDLVKDQREQGQGFHFRLRISEQL